MPHVSIKVAKLPCFRLERALLGCTEGGGEAHLIGVLVLTKKIYDELDGELSLAHDPAEKSTRSDQSSMRKQQLVANVEPVVRSAHADFAVQSKLGLHRHRTQSAVRHH